MLWIRRSSEWALRDLPKRDASAPPPPLRGRVHSVQDDGDPDAAVRMISARPNHHIALRKWYGSMDPVLKFAEEYADILHNLEFAIVIFHDDYPDLLDYDVEGALDVLIAGYTAGLRGKTYSTPQMSELRRSLMRDLLLVCEWRLGRASLLAEADPAPRIVSAEEIVVCLKRIRKSVRMWTKEAGRQGYLRFIRQYVVV
jgi:hypothetical protein